MTKDEIAAVSMSILLLITLVAFLYLIHFLAFGVPLQ